MIIPDAGNLHPGAARAGLRRVLIEHAASGSTNTRRCAGCGSAGRWPRDTGGTVTAADAVVGIGAWATW